MFSFQSIFGKPYDGSICKFGEQVQYKLCGRLFEQSRTALGVGSLGWQDGADG